MLGASVDIEDVRYWRANLADILRRFRPAVAPGPAAPAGVPADRVMEAEAELAVVFAALGPAVTEASALVEQARVDADRRRQAGVEEAQRIVDGARARLDSVRAEAANARLAESGAERAALEAETSAEIERTREFAAGRLPGLVGAVLGGIWATADPGPSGPLSGARDAPAVVEAGAEGRTV